LNHFTQPWDYNWGAFPPEDATPPSAEAPTGPPPCTDSCCGPVVAGAGPGSPPNDVSGASVISCREQLLRETIQIAGTPYSLHYASNRVPGRRADYQVEIPLTNATPPASLLRIDLAIEVAGREFKSSHAPAPNLVIPFEWDGVDAFGRLVQGEQALRVTVTYVYPLTYAPTSSFGAFGSGAPLTGNDARSELYSSRTFKLSLSAYNAQAQGLGGWTLSAVNNYDPVARSLQFGSGSRREQDALPAVVTAVAGPRNGTSTPVDGGAALATQLAPYTTAIDAQGRAYVSRATPGELWRVNRNATLIRLAPSVDWGRIEGMDVGADGSLYVAITDQHVVKRLTPGGMVETVAGTGVAGFSGDGGLATLAMLNAPNDVTVARDGSVYIYDQNERLRRVFPDGTIRTVAGVGHIPSPLVNPAPGTSALSHHIHLGNIAASPDGSVYATAETDATPWKSIILRFDPDGTVTTHAGSGCASCVYEHGQAPLLTDFYELWDIDVDDSGILYVNDHVRLVAVHPHVVETIVGCGGPHCTSIFLDEPLRDGSPARQHLLPRVGSVNAGPDGIYFNTRVATQGQGQVYRVQPALPAGAGTAIVIGSASGDEFFEFDANGRHLTTRHALTGSNLLTISYDSSSRLSEVRDEVNLATTVERNVSGTATAIVGPFGQRTELEIGPDGYLASVEHPTGETVSMTYHSGGLLATFTNARGGVSEMTYDAAGRLELDEDAANGSHTLARSGNNRSFSVDRTTALGRTTTYDTDVLDDGQLVLSTTNPDGTVHTSATVHDGAFEFDTPDGTSVTQIEAAETRFGLAAPLISRTTVLPSGLTNTVTTSRTYTNLNPQNFLDFTSFTHTEAGSGPLGSTTYTPSTRTFSRVSGASRSSTRIIDTLGRTTRTETSGIAPVDYFYDSAGRLDRIVQSTRTTQYAYFASGPAAGYLESVTDPLGVATVYTRDAAGRPLTETRAGATTTYTWDESGNLASVTPPGKPVHTMPHTPVSLLESYQPPAAGLPLASTAYTYDPDRMLRTETRPTSQQIVRTPDAFGRLDTVTFPGGALDYDYVASNASSGAGKTSSIAGPYGVDLGFTYDGFLNTGVTWSGDVVGSVGWQYNTRFARTFETVTGATGSATTTFRYDNDLLLTCASPTSCILPGADALLLTRSPQHGMVTNLALGNTSEALTYNTFGELATQNAQYSGSPRVNITYHATGAERDALGRIVQKTEVIGGISKVFTYEYDNLGRLEDVFIDGVLDEHFGYDLNGNRTTHFSATTGATVNPTYDDQDRLLTHGTWTFTYTENGELETKTNTATGDEWIYGYDVLGNLLTVGLPEGDLVEYLIDGLGRRVGKIFNGTLISQWIYRDALKPVAELNGSGALIAQFVYGSKSNVPDYVRRGGNTYRVVSDHLGSPRYVVNVANPSDVPFTASYAAFGTATGTGLDWMPFGFAGGIYDPDTGLVRFGARDYDPSVGRWTSKDPIRFDGGVNLYAYAENDPVNGRDPSGKIPIISELMCTYHLWQLADTYEECREEVKQKANSASCIEELVENMEGGSFTGALNKCVKRRDPGRWSAALNWCSDIADQSTAAIEDAGPQLFK
jgi:RHS repeat-associated protein